MTDPTLSKKRYVLLSDAGRISGYTNEYVERLCRIGKIPCRMMGEKTIVELDSLLSQTGTILLGGEHVGFVEVGPETPYPIVPVDIKESDTTPAYSPEAPSRAGRIAVVGETVHGEDGEKPASVTVNASNEKFPSNALPFFSSMSKGKSGFHIPVSSMSGASVSLSMGGPSSPQPEKIKQPMHIVVAKEGETPTTPVKNITVMPQSIPVGFTPVVPVSTPATPPPIVTPAPSSVAPTVVSGGASPLHDHDLERYASKLPMLMSPTSLVGKSLFAVLAVGLLILPSALGVGNVLSQAIKDIGGSFQSSGHMMMAAVGLINPDNDTARFPYLLETSRLLSATGASGGQTQTGIVVTPSTGTAEGDAQIKDVIQKTFSTPVDVIPDGKGSRTGLIKPTFQKNNNTNYIYMMVPFRN